MEFIHSLLLVIDQVNAAMMRRVLLTFFPVRACVASLAPVVLTRPQSSFLLLIRSHYHTFDYPIRWKQPHYRKKYSVGVSYSHSVLKSIALGGTQIN